MIAQEDLILIKQNPSIEAKNIVATKVCDYYQQPDISTNAKNIAEAIFLIMLEDVEQKVREILAAELKNSKELPSNVVKKLVDDIDEISIPFISEYKHFSNQDIIAILSTDKINKHIAVALRKNLSYEISDYIVHNCHSRVVEALIINKDAKILDETLELILKKYSHDEKIKECLVQRPALPVSFMSNLLNFLSQELLRKLIETQSISEDAASNVIESIKEKSVLKISEELSTDEQIQDLARELHKNDKLTPSLILRAICMGDIKFFEYGLMFLSNTPIIEIRKILNNTSQDFMIRNLFRKAGVPKQMFVAMISALKIIKELKISIKKHKNEDFSKKVTERILSFSLAGEGLSDEDINYLISRIN